MHYLNNSIISSFVKYFCGSAVGILIAPLKDPQGSMWRQELWRKDSGQKDRRELTVSLLSLFKQIIEAFNFLWEREKFWLYFLAFAHKQKAKLKNVLSCSSKNWVLSKFIWVSARETFPASVSVNRRWLKKQPQKKKKKVTKEEIPTLTEKGWEMAKGLLKKMFVEEISKGSIGKC